MDEIVVEESRRPPLRWAPRSVVTLVRSEDSPKARMCILAMYANRYADRVVTCPSFPWRTYFQQRIPVETRSDGLIELL